MTAGGNLYVVRAGDTGPPVVLLHGFGGNTQTWSPWIDDLSRDHQLHLIDLKGFGQAPAPKDGRYSPRDLAAPVVDYIEVHRLRPLTLIGHSLGGAVALLVALALWDGREDYLARLVLVSSAAYPQSVPPFIRLVASPAIGGVLLRLIPARWLVRKALQKVCYDPATISDEQVNAYAAPMERPGGRYAIRTAAQQLVPDDAHQVYERYGDLDVPTLLLWGRHDSVVPLTTAHRLDDTLPQSDLRILERCGHIPSEELPRESLAAVRSFFARHPTPS